MQFANNNKLGSDIKCYLLSCCLGAVGLELVRVFAKGYIGRVTLVHFSCRAPAAGGQASCPGDLPQCHNIVDFQIIILLDTHQLELRGRSRWRN